MEMESVWRLFPEEILETKILPRLPIASLCRFRAVSKKWNAWISHRDFAARHALATHPEDCVLITMKRQHPQEWVEGWDVMDVANNKVFTLSDDFLQKYVSQNVEVDMEKVVVAADGGLFFIEYYSLHEEVENDMLLVCNPILKSVKLLPLLPGGLKSNQKVVMSTDKVSMEYEIIVFEDEIHQYHTSVDIYESKFGRWRNVKHPVAAAAAERVDGWNSLSSIVKLNLFYRVFKHNDVTQPNIVAYDKATGGSSKLDLSLSVGFRYGMGVELVVSQHHMYCVSSYVMERNGLCSIEIFEVDPVRLKCTKCTEMPSEFLEWVLGDDLDERIVKEALRRSRVVVSTGCASSIMICSSFGRSVGYDLVQDSWHQYSNHNLLSLNEDYFGFYFDSLFCSHDCVSLCDP